MVLCGPNGKIHFVNAQCPGSYHDSAIFKSSTLFKKLFEEKWLPFPGGMIIGDGAYVRNYWFMITPLQQAQITDQRRALFNQAICAARSPVENCFGQLKKRFFILKGGMRFMSMKKCAMVIYALCAIHNFVKRCNNVNDDFQLNDDDLAYDSNLANEQNGLVGDQVFDLNNRQATNEIILERYF